MTTQTSQTVHVYNYGSADQMVFEQVPRPVPQEGEVLIKVHAAGVNPVDWKIRAGWFKDFRPMQLPYIPGVDIAGVIEEVGPGVTDFQKGQAVFGQGQGAYAEYVRAVTTSIALKPDALSFDEAAAIPVGATTAWQGLFDHGQLQSGQRVLITGASGGVGLFAIQFARWKEAEVIGTTSTKNVEYVRSLGAQTVIDYTQTKVEEAVHDADLVFETVGGEVLTNIWPTLKRGGSLVTIAGQPDEAKANELGIRAERFSAQVSAGLLQTFARLVTEGKLKVTINTILLLHEARQAHELSEHGHGLGRIVLHIAD